jgi:hypothetical protein
MTAPLTVLPVVVLDCPVCCDVTGPLPPAEADQRAGAHDDQNHRGRPTIDLRPDNIPARAAAVPRRPGSRRT